MKKTNKTIYQKKAVSLNEVIDHIDLDPRRAPKIILTVSPVRCGSTALMRIFAAAGIQTHFQELKNVLRWLMTGSVHNFHVPKGNKRIIMLKETLGPYTELECEFNPLRVLLEAGLSPDKLHLVILGRSIEQTWISWKNLWKDVVTPELFAKAFLTTEQIRLEAKERGVRSTCICFEIFEGANADVIFEKIFGRLQINYPPGTAKGWQKLPAFGASGSNIIFPVEPETFSMPEGLVKIIQSRQFSYIPHKACKNSIDEAARKTMVQKGLFDIYDNWFQICQKEII